MARIWGEGYFPNGQLLPIVHPPEEELVLGVAEMKAHRLLTSGSVARSPQPLVITFGTQGRCNLGNFSPWSLSEV